MYPNSEHSTPDRFMVEAQNSLIEDLASDVFRSGEALLDEMEHKFMDEHGNASGTVYLVQDIDGQHRLIEHKNSGSFMHQLAGYSRITPIHLSVNGHSDQMTVIAYPTMDLDEEMLANRSPSTLYDNMDFVAFTEPELTVTDEGSAFDGAPTPSTIVTVAQEGAERTYYSYQLSRDQALQIQEAAHKILQAKQADRDQRFIHSAYIPTPVELMQSTVELLPYRPDGLQGFQLN
jgi:hypothetical protein